MLATSHALAGAIIATSINHPLVAMLVAVISHPLLDLFPHWDFNSRWSKFSKRQKFAVSTADSLLGYGLGLLIFSSIADGRWLILMMFLAQWTDYLEAPYHFGFDRVPFFAHVKRLQHLWHTKADWPWGFIPQVLILMWAIWIKLASLI